jgi:hypothetical protein
MNSKIISFIILVIIIILFLFLAYSCIPAQEDKEDLSPFLRATRFIDSNHPRVVKKALELTNDCETEDEKVRALFEFVRDSYNDSKCESFIASEVLECGANSCRQRSILLAALCRAVGIPARLHLQRVTIKDWKAEDGEIIENLTFAHGITGIHLIGTWRLYESVGNKDKWIIWTQDEKRGSEMPVEFYADRDCLFQPDEKIIIETLAVNFADRTEEMIELIEKIDSAQ